LLAAARQYEKEGKSDLASRYYQQVLALDPQNVEARRGLEFVHSGRPRSETGYDEIVATGQPTSAPLPRTRKNLEKRKAELDAMTIQLIADAAASAKHVKPSHTRMPESMDQSTVIASKSRTADPLADAATVDAQTAHTHALPPLSEEEMTLADDDKALFLEMLAAGQSEQDSASSTSPETASSQESAPEIQIVSAEGAEQTEAFDWAGDTWADGAEQERPPLSELCQDCNAAILREVAKLESDDPLVRKDGLHNLAQMGPDAASASECVTHLLNDDVPIVQAYAAWTIWELSDDAATAVPILSELLTSHDANVVQFCAYTLSWMGEQAEPAAATLRQLLTSHDKLIRVHAAEALIHIEPPGAQADAVETLILLTSDPSTSVRSLALVALGDFPDETTPEIMSALTNALHDRDAEVRAAAALSLGAFGEPSESTIAQLEFVATSDEEQVRQAAATALECIRR
jgi:HEAT repeat protein